MKIFDEKRDATLQNVSWLRSAMRRALEGLHISEDLVNDIQLAISELMTNIVVHSSVPPQFLRLSIEISGTSLRIEIEDDASPFEAFQTMWSAAARKELAATDVSGLGLALARSTLMNVTYEPGPSNRLVGWRPLARRRPAVLVVEDDPTLLRLYAAMLGSRYRVLEADSIEAATMYAETRTIDLILCDFHIGEERGTNLLKELERDPDRMPVPVIMMSGDDRMTVRSHAETYGVEEFLLKPVGASTLRSAVERALHSSARRLAGLLRHFGASADKLLAPPSPDQLNALSIGHRSGNATAGGGDFLLHFRILDGDRFVLADMMGHGLGAKAAALAYAATMRTVQLMTHGDAGEFLRQLSDVLRLDHALSELLATVIVVDRKLDGTMVIASAAHPMPVLMSAAGVKSIDVTGPILGLFAKAEYQCVRVAPAPGERVVLVTDGVEPMWIAGGGDLPEGLVAVLVQNAGAPLETAIAAAEQWLVTSLGPAPRDDWTIMLLE
jgi:serine/threonine-protein kinase RsbW